MTCYISIGEIFQLTYMNGILQSILVKSDDLVMFDGLKHQIALFEEQLDKDLFKKQ